MVAALVLITFVAFVVIDYILQTRRSDAISASAGKPAANFEQATTPMPMGVVGGFKLPANLSYHPGHTWAMKEAHHLVRIGLDDLAVRLVGQVDRLDLPARGRWLRQGEKGWTITRGDQSFEMLSPIEGEVVDVNPAVLKDPSIVHDDPYGVGWLVAVNAPAADGNLHNLMHGRLAQRWMEESVATLHALALPAAGAYAQDGGHAVDDLKAAMPAETWQKVVRQLFLS